MFVSHLYVFLEKRLFSSLTFFFFFSGIELHELLVYILEIILSVVSFTIVFSHSEGCFFTLLIVSFIVQKL